jgi:hypothetical protein
VVVTGRLAAAGGAAGGTLVLMALGYGVAERGARSAGGKRACGV